MTAKRIVRILLLFSLMGLATGACTQTGNPSSQDVKALTFMAGYKPQANLPFVGVYVAEEKGYFDTVGLDVTIEHSAGRGEHLQLLAAGKIDVTTQDAGVMLRRRVDPGLPLISIALLGQRGQQAFVALKSSGLETVADWEGHKVGFKGTPPPELLALLDVAGLDEEAVELINVGFDPRVLTERKVDVYPVFKSNEPYLLRTWGYELQQWAPEDYGIPTLGLTYVTTPEVIEKDPDRIARFVEAVLRGVEYAEAHPAEAIDYVLKYAGPETDREHMRFMLEAELRDARSTVTAEHGIGWQTQEQWQELAHMLVEYGVLEQGVDVSDVFTTEFLK